jgi:hypothetical protein
MMIQNSNEMIDMKILKFIGIVLQRRRNKGRE